MKDKIFGVLQRIGRSFMLPIAILPVAGLLLGIGSSFTNATMIETYGLQTILGDGTILNSFLTILSKAGSVIFDNLPIIFAVGVAIGMAKKEKEVAALAAMISFFVMNATINAMLVVRGDLLADGSLAGGILSGTVTSVCGIQTLQMGVFGGIIVGLGVASLHNHFYKIQLPNALSFFGGSRFVPIISTLTYVLVGILLYFIWPTVQNGIYALGGLVTGTGYLGTLIFGIIKRALIPFGLHHVFYLPFWQTAVGGTMEVAGQIVEGGQNIFFAQLADPTTVHFSADATRYFSGEFIFMIFGLPGAALAMYQCAKPEKKKQAGGLLLSAALACMMTGITEPLEFSFLFVAPILFAVQVVLAGAAYMIAHILNIAVGLTFSGGLLDLFLFGILQGNAKTSWLRIIPVGIIYFLLYYIIFKTLILKLNLKTPGREDDDEETKLYTKADYKARENGAQDAVAEGAELSPEDQKSALITRGLGGKKNISDVDCCATRLRCTVVKPELVNEAVLKMTSPSGIIRKGEGIQIIYGPSVPVIKSNLEDYLEKAPNVEYLPEEEKADAENETAEAANADQNAENNASKAAVKKVLCAPFKGVAAPISEACDDAFAQKMMGDGYLIRPEEGMAYAPEDAEVSFIFPSKHAIGLSCEDGTEYLLHIGVDTVKLDGEGFETFVNEGDHVKKGDKLIGFDIEYIKEHAKSDECMVVLTSLQEGEEVRMKKTGQVEKLDETAEIIAY
nr:PTS transporter subunit IIABC [uncultured Mediterraneibacter sp.]